MSKLVAITYPTEDVAKQVMDELASLEKGQLLDLDDAVYVTKDQKGKIKVHQNRSLAGEGALGGGLWGMLIGMLFFAPFLGLAIGAATGAIAGGMSDTGIDDQFMKNLANKMEPGNATVFMLIRSATTDKVKEALSQYGGDISFTNLTAEQEEQLRKLTHKSQQKTADRDDMYSGAVMHEVQPKK